MSASLLELLNKLFQNATQAAFPELPEYRVEVAKSTQTGFGHYQYNSAMKLAGLLKQNPRKIAESIMAHVGTDALIDRLEVAGPGFINIWLAPAFLGTWVASQLHDPKLLVKATKRQKIIVDFSSPNIAKEMHVGHLRSTIIGDCLARVFEFLGHDVLRLNHVGDFGTSFGMLIAYIKEHCYETINHVDDVTLSELVTFYRASKVRFDEDADFKKRAQLEVVALQASDPETVKIWKIICEISRRAYQEIYDLLDIRLTERGESFYNPMLSNIVEDFQKKGLVTLSEGAKCVFLDGFTNREGEKLPLMIQKSDGGYNYDTTDLAAIRHRVEQEKADRIICVTDSGQATHFAMIFQAAEKAGYLDTSKVRVDHVPFGLVLGADGKKFKTRSGDTEKLIDLLTTAISKAAEIVKARHPEWDGEQQMQVSQVLGIGAVKYSDLSCNRVSDYAFSYEKMLRFEGNTIAFVMYSYVRAKSILRKIGVDVQDLADGGKTMIRLEHPSEIALALHLARFPEMVEQITQDLLPNRLTDYLYELAETFNVFFRDCRVEGVPEQNSRLLLTEDVRRVFEMGLTLLGIRLVDRM